MSDVLAKKHESLVTAKEIMDSLKGMFGQPEWSLRHEAIKYIYTKRMKERTVVREHVLDMMVHFNLAKVNGGVIDEANQENSSWKRLSEGEITLKVGTGEMVSDKAVGDLKLFFNDRYIMLKNVLIGGLVKSGLLSQLEDNSLPPCASCLEGKMTKRSFTGKDRPSSSTKVVDKTRNIGQTHPSQELGEPRRSGRVVRQPDRYLGLSEAQIVIPDNGIEDPLTYKQAMNDVDCNQWVKAMDLKMESMYSNYVWTLVDQPNDVKHIGCKWIYKRKRDQADARKSTSGSVSTLNRGVIVWRSIKQSCIADSTMEAEYVAVCEAAKEAVWLKKFLTDLEIVPNMHLLITLYCDNSGGVANSREPRSHKREKHIERKYHLIRKIVH
ncbi:gag/pol protein [Cucumis melo var. makuwa]|uniref:Gag/pol protein n=1 Tax=Cucumis melo var. makuwa TaxID=1194695 RepID=A0A5D3BB36_CUCMM|nr:gag/pol protein [Cucumis melo var. makuwa]